MSDSHHELKKLSPLRHELGNLLAILQGRLMRMDTPEVPREHFESLLSLQKRLNELYHALEEIQVPKN
jgi:hypothetical protein